MWPLFEFWQDKVEVQMRVLRAFIEPIVRGAVEEKRTRGLGKGAKGGEEAEVLEGESLVKHLVKVTDGGSIQLLSATNVTELP